MPRLTFFQLFRLIDANTLEVLKRVKIGSIIFDKGATLTKGTLVAGLDLFKYVNLDAEFDVDSSKDTDITILKKITYKEN